MRKNVIKPSKNIGFMVNFSFEKCSVGGERDRNPGSEVRTGLYCQYPQFSTKNLRFMVNNSFEKCSVGRGTGERRKPPTRGTDGSTPSSKSPHRSSPRTSGPSRFSPLLPSIYRTPAETKIHQKKNYILLVNNLLGKCSVGRVRDGRQRPGTEVRRGLSRDCYWLSVVSTVPRDCWLRSSPTPLHTEHQPHELFTVFLRKKGMKKTGPK
jgi:hypothetical protein